MVQKLARLGLTRSSRRPNHKGPTTPSGGGVLPSRIIGGGEMADLVRGFDWQSDTARANRNLV